LTEQQTTEINVQFVEYLQLSIVIMQGKSKRQTKQQNWIMQRQQWMN